MNIACGWWRATAHVCVCAVTASGPGGLAGRGAWVSLGIKGRSEVSRSAEGDITWHVYLTNGGGVRQARLCGMVADSGWALSNASGIPIGNQ